MQPNDWAIVALGFIVVYFVVDKVRAFVCKVDKLCSSMEEHLVNDAKRMQLLNDALVKLATDLSVTSSAADEVRRLVASAADESNKTGSYGRDVRDLMGQGYDETEASRMASDLYNDGMLRNF